MHFEAWYFFPPTWIKLFFAFVFVFLIFHQIHLFFIEGIYGNTREPALSVKHRQITSENQPLRPNSFLQWFINFRFPVLAKWVFYLLEVRKFKTNQCFLNILGWKGQYQISILFLIMPSFFFFKLTAYFAREF